MNFLSYKQQKLLLEIFEKGETTKKDNNIYKSHKFWVGIKPLLYAKVPLIYMEQNHENRNSVKYKLTVDGTVFVSMLKGVIEWMQS